MDLRFQLKFNIQIQIQPQPQLLVSTALLLLFLCNTAQDATDSVACVLRDSVHGVASGALHQLAWLFSDTTQCTEGSALLLALVHLNLTGSSGTLAWLRLGF